MQHIQNDHAEAASEDMIAFLLSSCMTITIGVTRCPLCDSSGPESDPEFIQHVLRCIHDFSLTSLPWSLHAESFSRTTAFNLDYLRKKCDTSCLHNALGSNPYAEDSKNDTTSCPSILPWLLGVIPLGQDECSGDSEKRMLAIEIEPRGIDTLDECVPSDIYFDVRSENDSIAALDRSSRSFEVHEEEDYEVATLVIHFQSVCHIQSHAVLKWFPGMSRQTRKASLFRMTRTMLTLLGRSRSVFE